MALGCLLALAAARPCHAQAFVESLFPPSVARGKITRVTVAATDVRGPIGWWTSLPAGMVTATPVTAGKTDGASFDVQVSAECPLGLYGMRMATVDGLSNPHLFIIDELPPQTTHDDAAKSLDETPIAVAGRLTAAAVDRFPIEVKAGQRVTFEIVASRLGKDADPLITVRDAQGRFVAQCDNDVGLCFDCRFEHTFATAGAYVVEVRDARYRGSPHWTYLLRLGRLPADRVAMPATLRPGEQTLLNLPQSPGQQLNLSLPGDCPLGPRYIDLRRADDRAATWISTVVSDLDSAVELEPNDEPLQATAVALPAVLHGCLSAAKDRDCFEFDLNKGQRLTFRGESRTLGGAADLEMVLSDPDGREVQRVDDTGLDEGSFTYAANREGLHRLQVRDMANDGGPAFAYRVEVRTAEPQLQLTSDTTQLVVPQGAWQAVPLTATRSDFKGPIELRLEGGPPGLRIEPNVIAEEATSAVCRLTAPPEATLGIYSLRIVGRAQVGDAILSSVVRVQPLVDRQLINVDLIKYALREDQRRLPPTLTDRLALMITPPAPFDVELPSPLVVLPRFQQADLVIATTRSAGFESPIRFAVAGGQLGDEAEDRNRVFARLPSAQPGQSQVVGTLHSRILSNEAKVRVDLSATSEHQGRKITLVRTFDLDVKPAFDVTIEPAQVSLEPSGSIKLKISATRLPSFAGPIGVNINPVPGLTLPETITLAAGTESAEIDLAIPVDFAPRKYKLRYQGTGEVNKFEEETRAKDLDIEVKKPEPVKK